MKLVLKILSWIVGSFFAIFAVSAFATGGLVSGIVFLLGCALFAPLSILKKIKGKIKVGKVLSVVLAAVLFVIGCVTMPEVQDSEYSAPDHELSAERGLPGIETIPSNVPTVLDEGIGPEELPVHEHSYAQSSIRAATCMTEGQISWVCSCGDTYDEIVAAIGHEYEENLVREATCAEEGLRTFTCLCGDTYDEPIAKTTHDYSIEVLNTSATCTADGFAEMKCSMCDDKTKTIIPATGHSTDRGACSYCGELITTGMKISASITKLSLTKTEIIKFTVIGDDISIVCDYNDEYVQITWGSFIGDNINLSIEPLRSGDTSITVYIEEVPSIKIEIPISVNLSSGSRSNTGTENENTKTYVLNTNTNKFHYTYCRSVDQMKEKNKRSFTGTRNDVISMGYSPCGNCKP